jgi:long-chain acyl-CoA synthetase
MPRDTLLDFFYDFSGYSDVFLLYDDGFRKRSYSYRESAEAARAFAAVLRQRGIEKGEKVIVWSENRPEWIFALWGCLLEGVVLVPVDYRSSPGLLSRIAGITGAKLALAGGEVQAQELKIPVLPIKTLAHWENATSGAVSVTREITRDHLAEIIFTSGATADPKGVLITHRNILANIVPVEREMLKYRKYARPFRPIRFLNLLPLSHLFGQAMATFIPPMLAGEVVFMRGHNPKEIVRQVHSRRISVIICVPKILEVLREYIIAIVPEAANEPPAGEKWLLRWWRYRRVHRALGWKFWSFVVGAAPLDPELEQFWSRLGYVVIQGYGLTETAPIVTLNHPFHTRKGTVGKPIAGVEVKIAPDGEVLVRGENVTSGYFQAEGENRLSFENGWLHTGDIGSLDAEGRLQIRGRKKEMIVTPEGLNVFPEDVERVLNAIPGVRDSAAVGKDRVHAVLILDPDADVGEIVRQANGRLEDHQQVRSASVWPGEDFPRTEGTRKLKRGQIAAWHEARQEGHAAPQASGRTGVLAKYAPGTPIAELGLSSLERIELMMELEQQGEGSIDEAAFTAAKTVGDLAALARQPRAPAPEPFQFPKWNRSRWADALRRINLPLWILPLARVFAWVRAEGLGNLKDLEGPVIFASNHQSYFDGPAILMAMPPRWRYRVGIAARKEFFEAHFHPRQHSAWQWFTNTLNYVLASLFFNIFPLPQREAGTKQALEYIGELAGDGWSILIFPEGRMTDAGEVRAFQPGVGMMAARLGLKVVPVRIRGLERVLNRTARFPTPGRCTVQFGKTIEVSGDDYAAIAKQIEAAVRDLVSSTGHPSPEHPSPGY